MYSDLGQCVDDICESLGVLHTILIVLFPFYSLYFYKMEYMILWKPLNVGS